jgi:sugar phosphate isomerase/epimerase
MWLTGFDVKSLATVYLDKPLKAHTLMQTIARANRVCDGKSNGLIVDYIGVVKALKELCAELRERGQTFSFETGEELPLTLSIMMSEIGLDNVGVNFDPANLISGGRSTNPCDAMELLGSRVTGFHIKDAVPAKFGEYGGKQTPIGEGKVNFKQLLTQLKEFGYKGDVVIEHEMHARPDRDGDIIRSREYIEGIISEIFE